MLQEKFTSSIHRKREFVFFILSGLFLGTLVMLNILGATKIIDLSFEVMGNKIPFAVTVGVLPYPITFLCTDFISELYGKRRANQLVWVGLILNLWLLLILWLGAILPPNYPQAIIDYKLFYDIKKATFGATFASMIAYLIAQFIDVNVFHYLKDKTKGKKLWLRNNVSTMTSQLLDTVAVLLIIHFTADTFQLTGKDDVAYRLFVIIYSSYIFKFFIALVDTLPFYYGVSFLRNYLELDSDG